MACYNSSLLLSGFRFNSFSHISIWLTSLLPEASLLFLKHAEHDNKSELQYLLLLLPILFFSLSTWTTHFFFWVFWQCHHDKESLFSLVSLYNIYHHLTSIIYSFTSFFNLFLHYMGQRLFCSLCHI